MPILSPYQLRKSNIMCVMSVDDYDDLSLVDRRVTKSMSQHILGNPLHLR